MVKLSIISRVSYKRLSCLIAYILEEEEKEKRAIERWKLVQSLT